MNCPYFQARVVTGLSDFKHFTFRFGEENRYDSATSLLELCTKLDAKLTAVGYEVGTEIMG